MQFLYNLFYMTRDFCYKLFGKKDKNDDPDADVPYIYLKTY